MQGTLPDEQEVAVKRLSQASREGLNQLHNEVQVLAQLQHIKLVRLLGYCSHQNEVMLVYEFVKNGCLQNFLFGNFIWNYRSSMNVFAITNFESMKVNTNFTETINVKELLVIRPRNIRVVF